MTLWTNLNLFLPLTVLCFLLMLNLFLLMLQFKGRWIAWKRCYMNSITLLLKLRKFSIQFICVLDKQPLVLANGVILKFKAWKCEVYFLLCFMIFNCTILKKKSSVYINFLTGLDIWMILPFIFLSIMTLLFAVFSQFD